LPKRHRHKKYLPAEINAVSAGKRSRKERRFACRQTDQYPDPVPDSPEWGNQLTAILSRSTVMTPAALSVQIQKPLILGYLPLYCNGCGEQAMLLWMHC